MQYNWTTYYFNFVNNVTLLTWCTREMNRWNQQLNKCWKNSILSAHLFYKKKTLNIIAESSMSGVKYYLSTRIPHLYDTRVSELLIQTMVYFYPTSDTVLFIIILLYHLTQKSRDVVYSYLLFVVLPMLIVLHYFVLFCICQIFCPGELSCQMQLEILCL